MTTSAHTNKPKCTGEVSEPVVQVDTSISLGHSWTNLQARTKRVSKGKTTSNINRRCGGPSRRWNPYPTMTSSP